MHTLYLGTGNKHRKVDKAVNTDKELQVPLHQIDVLAEQAEKFTFKNIPIRNSYSSNNYNVIK